MIVVDTNVLAYLFIKGEDTQKAKELLRFDSDWIAPVLWKSEFRNVMLFYIRRELVSHEDALILIKEAESLMLGNEYEVNSDDVLKLATNTNCSAYDCEFVTLAKKTGIKLFTSDKQILNEFPEYSMSLKDFTNKAGI